MREKAFGARERRSDGPDSCEAFSLDGLDIDALHKIQRTETTATARPSACGQNVIAAAGVIADWLRAPFAQENCSGCGNVIELLACVAV